jgi:purine-binding chemotaxis protein CheW
MVRGEVIAVFDPRRRLGLPAAAPGRTARVLVCDAGEGARALLVDAVTGVVRLPASAVEARPTGVGAASAEYIAGIGRERGRFFILLDLAAVLRDGPPAKAEAP